MSSNKKRLSLTNQNTELGVFIPGHMPGAPNENIVQNHLNIALLNVFKYLTVDIGIFLSPKNFPSVRIS